MVHQFTDENDLTRSNFFSFKEIGDKIQGTYIRKSQGIDGYKNEQIVYDLKIETGEVFNVGFRLTKEVIHNTMNKVRLGQIVEFRFVSEKEPKRASDNPTKIIKIFADPKIIDKEWIEQQASMKEDITSDAAWQTSAEKENTEIEKAVGEEPPFDIPGTIEEKKTFITELAKDKLKVTDDAQVMARVMEATGLAYIDSNIDNIIKKLQTM